MRAQSFDCSNRSLPRRNEYLNGGVWTESITISRVLLCVPVRDASLNLAEKILSALLCQVSEVANQIGDRVFLARSAMSLENLQGLSSARDVISFVDHFGFVRAMSERNEPRRI